MNSASPASAMTAPPLPGAVVGHEQSSGWHLALTALGICFGDIGTSPLYAFSVALKATGTATPSPDVVFGIVSLILWALIVMVTIKYLLFVLRADNDGEGGVLALLALGEPERANGASLTAYVLLGIIGAALLYGDGVITPAISVLSAMEGLKLAAPSLSTFVVPLTLLILVGLFVIQRR